MVSGARLCECGCGREVKPGRRFIVNHFHQGNKGKGHSSVKQKEAARKRWSSEEYRAKHHLGMNKAWESVELRNKHSLIQKVAQNKSEVIARSRQTAKESWGNPLYRDKVVASHLKTENLPATKAKKSKRQKELWERRPELRRQMSLIQKEVMTKFWKDPDKRERRLKAIGKALLIFPNKLEKAVMELLESLFPGEWKYTGDLSFIINGKNPDFVNVNGQKKCIEVFGDYWHSGQDPEERIKVFRTHGWETLVIWERELKNIDLVKERIVLFHRKGE